MSNTKVSLNMNSQKIPFMNSYLCDYQFQNIFRCEEGRLAEYKKKFLIPTQTYTVAHNAFLIPHNGLLIAFDSTGSLLYESWPHKYNITKQELENFQKRVSHIKIMEIDEDASVCSLIGSGGSYYHFFLDVLPRVFAAHDYHKKTGKKLLYLCDKNLSPWMAEALYLIGVTNREILEYDTATEDVAIRCRTLISRRGHRCNIWGGSAPYDALFPPDVHLIREKLFKGVCNYDYSNLPKKFLISRNDTSERRMLNQAEVKQLIGDDYKTVTLSSMGLIDQIRLFKNASHIISVHGAGLTNLMYSKGASILEIHALGHGVRPDFFQIAAMNGCDYYFDVCNSVNPKNDLVASLENIEKFLKISS